MYPTHLLFTPLTAILAYTGSFVLIRYKLSDAASQAPTPAPASPVATHRTRHAPSASAAESQTTTLRGSELNRDKPRRTSFSTPAGRSSTETAATANANARVPPLLARPTELLSNFLRQTQSSLTASLVLTRNISVSRVHPFAFLHFRANKRALAPGDLDGDGVVDTGELMRLLNRCHNVCALLSLMGFLQLMVGVLSYAWSTLDRAVSIYASACLAFTMAVGTLAIH